MRKNIINCLVLSLFVVLMPLSVVVAQTDGSVNTTNVLTASENSGDQEVDNILQEIESEEELEGVDVDVPDGIPSGLGSWFRALRENISLVLTFDPIKKAEKQLLYAEQRMKIAENIIAESVNPRAQEIAQKMIDRANLFMQKIEERKAKWEDKADDNVERLKKNLATHQIRRDKAMEKIEDKIPEDAKEKFEKIREEMLQKGERLLKAIENENLSEETREHLQNVKSRIESHAQTITEYREKKKELLKERTSENAEEIRSELKNLWEERKGKLQETRLEFRTRVENLKELAEDGDVKARERLRKIDKAGAHVRERWQSAHALAEEYRKLREEGLSGEELIKRMRELKEQQMETDNQDSILIKARRNANIIEEQVELRAEEIKKALE